LLVEVPDGQLLRKENVYELSVLAARRQNSCCVTDVVVPDVCAVRTAVQPAGAQIEAAPRSRTVTAARRKSLLVVFEGFDTVTELLLDTVVLARSPLFDASPPIASVNEVVAVPEPPASAPVAVTL
jgi:hypothetical protein